MSYNDTISIPVFVPDVIPAGTVIYIADWWLDAMQRATEKASEAGMPIQLPHLVTLPGAIYILSLEECYFAADLLSAE